MMVENRYACFEEIRALEKAIFGKKPFDNVSSLKDREEHERKFIKQSLVNRQQRLNASCPDTEENPKIVLGGDPSTRGPDSIKSQTIH